MTCCSVLAFLVGALIGLAIWFGLKAIVDERKMVVMHITIIPTDPQPPNTERGGVAVWDLVLDGKIRMTGESWTVVDQVRGALLGRKGVSGECREIAERLRTELEGENHAEPEPAP